MKSNILLYFILTMFLSGTFSSCDSDFVDINTDSSTVLKVDPATFLYNVQSKGFTAGSTWYDSYACKIRWMQYCANIWGYSLTNFTYFTTLIGSDVYNEYNNMGAYAAHMEYYISENTPDKLASYSNMIEAARVMVIYKGIVATDMHGSLAYTDAWGLRSGKSDPAHVEPKFQTQEELFGLWDTQLEEAVNKFKTNANQVSLKGYDQVFNGDMTKWVKAANSLRLRIALRIWKRLPTQAKAIAAEVLAGDIPQNIDDSFILYFDKLFTESGDWHSVIDMDRAAAPFMNYLKKYNDPRKRLYFQINNLTPENIAKFNSEQTDPAKYIPTTMTQWEGGTVSYDYRTTDQAYINRSLKDGTDMRAMNKPQTRLWKGMQDNGSGGSWFPLVTYADFCFMAAEFVLEGVASSKTAQQWYEEGVKSSLEQWSKIGDYCKINGYQAVTPAEITAFMSQPDIAWDPAKAKEQIYSQSFVEHFKNNNESWALWRRTGYPSQQTTIIKWDDVMIQQQVQKVPRRTRFTYPAEGAPNYNNLVERLSTMEKDPEFGGVQNEFGRLWWDKQ